MSDKKRKSTTTTSIQAPSQRGLTPAEEKVYQFVKLFDKLSTDKKLTARIYMGTGALDVLNKENVAKPLRLQFDGKEQKYLVTFTLGQFKKYLEYCCKKVGFTILLDGSVVTFDKLLIEESSEGLSGNKV